MYYYLNMYFIGCFLGYGIETLLKTFFFSSMNNGILYGPWIPVYGFGIVCILFLGNFVMKLNTQKWLKIMILFSCTFFLLSFLEEMGGLLIEAVFHKKFWNYKEMLLNAGPYISIEMSLIWGILGVLFTCYVRPFFDLFIQKIPKVVTIGILFLHLMDIVFTWLIS